MFFFSSSHADILKCFSPPEVTIDYIIFPKLILPFSKSKKYCCAIQNVHNNMSKKVCSCKEVNKTVFCCKPSTLMAVGNLDKNLIVMCEEVKIIEGNFSHCMQPHRKAFLISIEITHFDKH